MGTAIGLQLREDSNLSLDASKYLFCDFDTLSEASVNEGAAVKYPFF